MEKKVDSCNAEYIKRQAKNLKRALGIPHHEALDKAALAAGFSNWRNFLTLKLQKAEKPLNTKSVRIPHNGAIPVGTLIRFKLDKTLGILFKSDSLSGTVEFYNEWGPVLAARHEVSVCRDQSSALRFKPMRLYLPYGKWTCKNGIEVLFNRDYKPLWAKAASGKVTTLDPDTWVIYTKQEWFYNDASTPVDNKETFEICMSVLRDWGVESQRTKLSELLPEAIRTGNMSILKNSNMQKKFPIVDA